MVSDDIVAGERVVSDDAVAGERVVSDGPHRRGALPGCRLVDGTAA
ncbi:hypothetical protein [Streptomyces sp. NPDC093568]